jgi:pyruvate/2-oxoglutarate dehydrogenase complex dihydrolipoamide acyltransferase (E2) component
VEIILLRGTRTKLVLVGAGGLLAAGAAWPAIAFAADNSPAPQSSTAAEPRHRGGGLHREESVAALAKELGVTEDKLKAALQAVRADRKPADRKSAERQKEYAAALAAKLGLSEDKVTAALEKVRAQAREDRQAQRTDKLGERLDKAVADGKLTKAEADAVRKAADAGVLWGEGR